LFYQSVIATFFIIKKEDLLDVHVIVWTLHIT